ncbi:MAG: ribosome biogenesis GTPase YlqF [Syntrophomonadaceae bacterium]|nr:ribosome biogenesis GTPase YlqF [Syntrophomonadaceae bacterium]
MIGLSVNWFPGHMVKARKEIEANLSLVDTVIILLDARAPFSCRNPMLEKIVSPKNKILLLNKSDLADPLSLNRNIQILNKSGSPAVAMNSLTGQGKKQIIEMIAASFAAKAQAFEKKGRRLRAVRVMVTGVPNIGKSTFLNNIVGRKASATGPQPGVTKGKQWVRLRKDIEFMDTPGIMWPKIENETQGLNLALLNIVGANAYDTYNTALYLINFMKENYPSHLLERFKIEDLSVPAETILERISFMKGHLRAKSVPEVDKTAQVLLQEFRGGKLGRMSLE